MARSNYTYRHKGAVFPLSTLTPDRQILELARRLKRQLDDIADTHLKGEEFNYVPINIPANLVHIFGK